MKSSPARSKQPCRKCRSPHFGRRRWHIFRCFAFSQGRANLGVNSSRSSSFGHLCAANENNLAKVLDDIQSDNMKTCRLTRLELRLNGKLLPELALNELLIAHSHPAATSRYLISLHGKKEEHRSSGIWVGTATGSSGSIRSAGGTVLPITEAKYEYLVREPCIPTRRKLAAIR